MMVIHLISDNGDERIAFGVRELKRVLAAKGLKTRRAGSLENVRGGTVLLVGSVAGDGWPKEEVDEKSLAIAEAPESYALKALSADGRDVVVASGRDETGAMYAALELSELYDQQGEGFDLLAVVPEKSVRPMLQVRGINFYLTAEALEDSKSWYHSADFWRGYFDTMARCRLNFLDLHGVWRASDGTLGTNLFPYIIASERFPHILAVSASQVEKNLGMLRTLTRMAKQRGVQVCLANQMGEVYSYWRSAGLSDEGLSEYTRECVRLLLQRCPDLGALGLRVAESWKEEDFYKRCYLAGIEASGRSVRLVVRSWGATKDKIEEIARDYQGEVSVEIKYNGEHLGLPYHAVTDESQQNLTGKVATSYTYQGYTVGQRDYSIIWQLRANGTHRIFRWGDPDFVRRCVKSCLLGGGLGFSLECLSGMIHQEDFCHKVDHSFYRWNYQRDWYWLTLWGRLAYDPDTPEEVWLAEFEKRFGPEGASLVCETYLHGSRIAPLIYAYHKLGMDSRHMAPELEPGGDLTVAAQVTPLDPNTLQAIPEYVADCLNGRSSGKRSPVQVARTLRDEAEACLDLARRADLLVSNQNQEWACTRMDMEALAYLGCYYAEKILAALELKFYVETRDRSRFELAADHTTRSHRWWAKLSEVTSQHYRPFYDFRLGVVHWSDRSHRESLAHQLDLLKTIRDPFPPKIVHTPVSRARLGRPLEIRANATDSSGIAWMKLHYKPIPTTHRWSCIEMIQENGSYRAVIPGSAVTPEGLMYYIEAVDKDGNGTISPDPERETPYITVSLPSSSQ